MAEHPHPSLGDSHQHDALPTKTSFRVLELLLGEDDDPISCILRLAEWVDLPAYEAISYAWGDPKARVPVIVDGKWLNVTVNLQTALRHLRYRDRPRLLWVDAICINQTDIPERGHQVAQMRKIYEKAAVVLIWVGHDTADHQAKVAVDSIITISDFLCRKLGIPVSELASVDNLYQEIMGKARDVLPLPNECDFSSDAMWKSLVWFYKHPYFTRVWAIQEVNANTKRLVHCGEEKVLWDRVGLVACYLTMETTFSRAFGFTDAYCWWAATMTTDLVQPKNFLLMLYLASNFSSLDPRDVIYGLWGMMQIDKGGELLEPDYAKSVTEVYRDSAEAALVNFDNTDVTLYVQGTEDPSWVPRWNVPMLFRNPFRFGKPLPWRPAGNTSPIWDICKETNILSLTGFITNPIEFVESYNENYFGNRILKTMRRSLSHVPFTVHQLAAVATSVSFGLNEKSEPEEDEKNVHLLTLRFVAYLKTALEDDEEDTFSAYVPAELAKDSQGADGSLFGKPVWDFTYPESSFFITQDKLMGCSISRAEPGDVVFVAKGCTFPLVLRPDGEEFRIRGFAYVGGLMRGEKKASDVRVVRLR
ncbi:heterokaryon incompatibility protein-domain-containing protein [Leptodontidium sp. 2 PMI_412]|nr:heterokaryon incompatibility protein-domain-containing protein [Leptodontidium sp. 2 PMI_412]